MALLLEADALARVETAAHVQRWAKLSVSNRGISIFAPSTAPSKCCSAKVFGSEQAHDTPMWRARHFWVLADGGEGASADASVAGERCSEGLVTVVMHHGDTKLGDICVTVGEWTSNQTADSIGSGQGDADAEVALCIGLGGAEGHLALAHMFISAIRKMHTASVQKLMDGVIRPSFTFDSRAALHAMLAEQLRVRRSQQITASSPQPAPSPSAAPSLLQPPPITSTVSFDTDMVQAMLGGAKDPDDAWQSLLLPPLKEGGGDGVGDFDEDAVDDDVEDGAFTMSAQRIQQLVEARLPLGMPPPAFVVQAALPVAPTFALHLTKATAAHRERVLEAWRAAIATAKEREACESELRRLQFSCARTTAHLQREGHADPTGALRKQWQTLEKAKGDTPELRVQRAAAARLLTTQAATIELMQVVTRCLQSTISTFIPGALLQLNDDGNEQRQQQAEGGGESRDAKTKQKESKIGYGEQLDSIIDIDNFFWSVALFHTGKSKADCDGAVAREGRTGGTPGTAAAGGGGGGGTTTVAGPGSSHTRGIASADDDLWGGSLLAATDGFFANTTHVERLIIAAAALCEAPGSFASSPTVEMPMMFDSPRLAFQSEGARASQTGTVAIFSLHPLLRLVVVIPSKMPSAAAARAAETPIPDACAAFKVGPSAFVARFVALAREGIEAEALAFQRRSAFTSPLRRRGDTFGVPQSSSASMASSRAGAQQQQQQHIVPPAHITIQWRPGTAGDAAASVADDGDEEEDGAGGLDVARGDTAAAAASTGAGIGGLFGCCLPRGGAGAVEEEDEDQLRAAARAAKARAAEVAEQQRKGTFSFRALPRAMRSCFTLYESVLDAVLEQFVDMQPTASLRREALMSLALALRAPNPNPVDYSNMLLRVGQEEEDDGRPALHRKLRQDYLSLPATQASFVKFTMEVIRPPTAFVERPLALRTLAVRELLATHLLHAAPVVDDPHVWAEDASRVETAARVVSKATAAVSGPAEDADASAKRKKGKKNARGGGGGNSSGAAAAVGGEQLLDEDNANSDDSTDESGGESGADGDEGGAALLEHDALGWGSLSAAERRTSAAKAAHARRPLNITDGSLVASSTVRVAEEADENFIGCVTVTRNVAAVPGSVLHPLPPAGVSRGEAAFTADPGFLPLVSQSSAGALGFASHDDDTFFLTANSGVSTTRTLTTISVFKETLRDSHSLRSAGTAPAGAATKKRLCAGQHCVDTEDEEEDEDDNVRKDPPLRGNDSLARVLGAEDCAVVEAAEALRNAVVEALRATQAPVLQLCHDACVSLQFMAPPSV